MREKQIQGNFRAVIEEDAGDVVKIYDGDHVRFTLPSLPAVNETEPPGMPSDEVLTAAVRAFYQGVDEGVQSGRYQKSDEIRAILHLPAGYEVERLQERISELREVVDRIAADIGGGEAS